MKKVIVRQPPSSAPPKPEYKLSSAPVNVVEGSTLAKKPYSLVPRTDIQLTKPAQPLEAATGQTVRAQQPTEASNERSFSAPPSYVLVAPTLNISAVSAVSAAVPAVSFARNEERTLVPPAQTAAYLQSQSSRSPLSASSPAAAPQMQQMQPANTAQYYSQSAGSSSGLAGLAGQATSQSQSAIQRSISRSESTESKVEKAVASGASGTAGPKSRSVGEPLWAPSEFVAKAVAIYDRASEQPDELSFAEGQAFYVLKMGEDGWWDAVTSAQGKTLRGQVPSNYLQLSKS